MAIHFFQRCGTAILGCVRTVFSLRFTGGGACATSRNNGFLPLIPITLLVVVCAAGAAPIETGFHEMTHHSAIDDTDQPYGLYVPEEHDPDGDPIPLVILLHGLGATWETYWNYLPTAEWAEDEGFVVATPDGRGNWYYVGPGETDVLEVIDEVKRICNVDEDRVYLMGHSMGGWGVWEMALSHPDIFAAIVPMASWAPLELLPELSNTPIFILHGDDDVIVPVERAREADAELTRLGIPHHYFEAPTWGHHSALAGHMFPVIARWLKSNVRSHEMPDEIHIRTYTPRRGARDGVGIIATEEFPDLASIDMDFSRLDRQFTISTNNTQSFSLRPVGRSYHAGINHTAVVDDQRLSLGTPADFPAAWVFGNESGRWTVRSAGRSELASLTPPAPVVAHLSETLDQPIEEICEIMAEATGSDTGIIRGVYACPEIEAGDVTADDILDLYLRPMDYLFIAEIPAGVIAEITTGERNIAAPEVDLSDPDRVYTVAVSEYIERRLPDDIEVRPWGARVSEVLYDHIVETGELP